MTKETNVHVKINLDGTGVANCSTGIPFLDHMLDVSVICLACVLLVISFFPGVGGGICSDIICLRLLSM